MVSRVTGHAKGRTNRRHRIRTRGGLAEKARGRGVPGRSRGVRGRVRTRGRRDQERGVKATNSKPNRLPPVTWTSVNEDEHVSLNNFLFLENEGLENEGKSENE